MNSKKYLFIFFHVEKCGGTSLLASSRMREGLQHCDIISSKRFGNVASKVDFEKSLRIYKKCSFITGHCLYPDLIEEYRDVSISLGFEPVFITSIRDPISRLLSDFAHAKRRGERMELDQYIKIPFKKNYICNFFGGGDLHCAVKFLNSIDYVVSIENFSSFIKYINSKYKMNMKSSILSNLSRKNELPKDLMFDGGVKVEKYSVLSETYNQILENNSLDIELIKNINYWYSEDVDNKLETVSEFKTRYFLGRLYRNLVYKPLMQFSLGHVYEKRNKVPHSLSSSIEFMWQNN